MRLRKRAAFIAAMLALAAVGAWLILRDEPRAPLTYRYLGTEVIAQRPSGDPAGLIILIAPAGGDGRIAELAERFLGQGVATVIVSLPDFSAHLRSSKKDCVDFGRIFHTIAKDAEHRLEFPRYFMPLIGGVDTGALAAYAGYRQSAAGMWNGVVTVDRAEALALPKQPCFGWGMPGDAAGTYKMDLKHRAGEAWVDLRDFSEAQFDTQVSPLIANASVGDGASLPVTIVAPALPDPAAPYVVMYSGDGGWAGLDRKIAAEFASRGYVVAGISSLEYFWKERPPAEAASDLQSLIAENAGTRRILLVGYSFGADVLPFIYAALPPETKARVDRLDLLGFANSADFEFHLSSWANMPSNQARPTVPFVDNLHGIEIRCIRGREEQDTACLSLSNPDVIQIALPGDHHFNKNAKAVVDALADPIRRNKRP